MTGLTVILTESDGARMRAALTLANATAALGGRARVYFHERAVTLLVSGDDPEAEELRAHGLPDRSALLATARESGVELIACQTGLAFAGIAYDTLADGVESGGMMGLLATLGDDRLLTL